MRQNHKDILKSQKSLWIFLLFLAAVTFIFRDGWARILEGWQREEYSHGYLIPPLVLILILNRLHKATSAPQTSWLGAIIVLLGVIAQVAFEFAGEIGVLPQIYLITIIGIFGLFFGKTYWRQLSGPLGLLFFCAPLPNFFYYTLSFNLQTLSTFLGTTLLTLIGVPVFQDGNVIDLGGYKLQVAEACSGIRYLFPLLGLSFLLAYLYSDAFWKRVFLFLSAIPIAVFMNGLRIALIGWTVDQWGPSMAEGLLHYMEGWVVFVGCTGVMCLEIFILKKIGNRGVLRLEELKLPSLKNYPYPAIGAPTKFTAAVLGCSLLISVIIPLFLHGYLKPVPLQHPLSTFPMQIGSWEGTSQTLGDKEQSVLGTREYLMADYTRTATPPVNLYVLYYPQQDSTSNQGIHSPSICIPAGGWSIDEKTVTKLTPANGDGFLVNRMVVSKGTTRRLVYYWFVQDGMPLWSSDLSKFSQIKNALTKGRSDGAMIRIYTPLQAEDPREDEERLQIFYKDVAPTLSNFLGWQSALTAQ